jgi:putative phosphoesterase
VTILIAGLLSDTHMPHRLKRLPDAVFDALDGVDVILHAGDVDDPVSLRPLRTIAPVHAVRGNVHLQDLSDGGAALPAIVRLELAGRRVVLTHGHRPGPLGFLLKGLHMVGYHLHLTDNAKANQRIARHLARTYRQADIIVFGHTHQACVKYVGHTLLVNPGAVCVSRWEQPTVARIRLGIGAPEVKVIPLPAESPGPQDLRSSIYRDVAHWPYGDAQRE